MITRKLLSLLAAACAAFLPLSSVAQLGPSAYGPFFGPNWPQNYTPTPFQWQLLWTNKVDYYPGGIPVTFGGTGGTTAAQARANLGLMGNSLPPGQLFIGNPSGAANPVTMSGDCTITYQGIITCSFFSGIVPGSRGGTGVDNTGKTITLGGNLATSGSFDATFTLLGPTNIVIPQTGTLLAANTVIPINGSIFNPISPPSNPAVSGAWAAYVDSTDANALKVKSSAGAVQTLASAPVAKTANYTLLASESGKTFSNTGASSQVDFTLPAAVNGMEFTVIASAAQTVRLVAPASVTIGFGDVATTVAGNLSATAYATATVKALSSTLWVVIANTGSWTVN